MKNVKSDSRINSQARARGSVNLIREKTKNRLHCQSRLTTKCVEVRKIANTKRLWAVLINARSIRNKFRELQALIKVKSWDIIGITEIWIHSQDRDLIWEFNINGYCIFNKDRINKEGGGVLLYIRETLKPTEINFVINHEHICIDVNLNIKIRLVLVYRKPK